MNHSSLGKHLSHEADYFIVSLLEIDIHLLCGSYLLFNSMTFRKWEFFIPFTHSLKLLRRCVKHPRTVDRSDETI